MSEKPFWAGKTLMEIQNLDKRVKVTMENGDVFIGKLVRRSRDTDGICSLSMQLDAHRTYLHVFSLNHLIRSPSFPVTSIPSNCWMTPTTSVSRRLMTPRERYCRYARTATATRSQMWKKGRNRFWGRGIRRCQAGMYRPWLQRLHLRTPSEAPAS